MRRFLGIAVVLACAGAGAASAHAATLTADGASRQLAFAAVGGEANWVQITDVSGGARIVDVNRPSLTLTEVNGATCTLKARTYRCDGAWTGIWIDVAEGQDQVDMWSAIPATIVAGAGAKTITAGSAGDRIYVRNGAGDTVACGAGSDFVQADPDDAVDASCETIDRDATGDPSAPGPDGGSGAGGEAGDPGSTERPGSGDSNTAGPGAPPLTAPIGIVLPAQPLTVASPRSAVAHLACSAEALDGCQGELFVSVFERRPLPRRPRGGVRAARGRHVIQQRRIGRRGYRLGRGKQAALPVRVAYRGRHTLVQRRRRARTKLTVVQRDASGKVLGVTTREAWVPLPKKWSRYRGRRSRR
jgi:hypothetical protein